MSLTILVDMDGVLADIHEEWISLYNKKYEDNLTQKDMFDWNFHKCVSPRCGEDMYKLLSHEGLYENAPVIGNSQEVLEKLHAEGYELVIVTATPHNAPNSESEKKHWIKKNFPFIPKDNFVATHRKDLVHGDVLIDDGPHNLSAYKRGISFTYDQPWNKSYNSEVRVKDWNHVYDMVSLIKELRVKSILA